MRSRVNHGASLLVMLVALSAVLPCYDAFVIRQGTREAGAAPTYASAVAPYATPTTSGTRLSMASTADEALKEIDTMRIGELKEELESYGINTKQFLEKSELIDALTKARADGLKPKAKATSTTTTTTSSTSSSSSSSSSSSTASESTTSTKSPEPDDSRPREERLKEEMAKCQSMKNAELKKELTERGISTASFFEKSEFVQALAEARVDGVTKASSSSGGSNVDEEGYAEYSNVEVLTADDAGPRPKGGGQQEQQQQSPFGGAGSPFGGAAGGNPFGGAGGMGGMGGIADILKNMGGGGGGAAGANPFAGGAGAAGANPFGGGANPFGGGMGGMGDAMGKAQEMMKNPKVMELMAKAQKNPKMMKIMQECMSNPMAMSKYQNDPEVAELIAELKKIM